MLASTSPIAYRQPCALEVAAEEAVHHSYIDLDNLRETPCPIGVRVTWSSVRAARKGRPKTESSQPPAASILSCRSSFLRAGLCAN